MSSFLCIFPRFSLILLLELPLLTFTHLYLFHLFHILFHILMHLSCSSAAFCDWLIPPNGEGSDWLAAFGFVAFALAVPDSLLALAQPEWTGVNEHEFKVPIQMTPLFCEG